MKLDIIILTKTTIITKTIIECYFGVFELNVGFAESKGTFLNDSRTVSSILDRFPHSRSFESSIVFTLLLQSCRGTLRMRNDRVDSLERTWTLLSNSRFSTIECSDR